jgi:predicted regulator of Ras-like GTPase activity (Roadblock/LC7/MglB family)
MTVDEPLRRLAQSQAQAMLADVTGVVAVIVASVDGFDVASAVTRGVDPARVAAMASSIAAIGVVVAQEAGLGRMRSVTISTDDGFALVSSARHGGTDLVVNVLAGRDAVLAQVVLRSADCVRALQAA